MKTLSPFPETMPGYIADQVMLYGPEREMNEEELTFQVECIERLNNGSFYEADKQAAIQLLTKHMDAIYN